MATLKISRKASSLWKSLTDKELPGSVRFNRASAILWVLILPFALLFWPNSVVFVIIASVYANVKSDWGTAEAANPDPRIMQELLDIKNLVGRRNNNMAVTIYNNTDAVRGLITLLRTANATVDGDIIDRADTNASVMWAVQSGTVTDGTWTFTIKDSDDGVSFAAANAAYIQGAPCVFAPAANDTVKELGYNGPKRYVRLSVTSTAATTGALLGAVAIFNGGRKPNVR